jgi:Lon protease-like protein
VGLEHASIALFPLPNVVLFPGLRAPLHVFEPRYRQMTEDALAGERVIGMIAVPARHHREMQGDPSLYPVGCVGRIAEATQLSDGRFHIVLEGTSRFRVVEEAPRSGGRLYRVARVALLPEVTATLDRDAARELRRRAVAALARILRGTSAGSEDLDAALFGDVHDAVFAGALAQVLDLAVEEKQALLEVDDAARRLERLVALLEFRVAELAAPGRAGPETVH